MLAHMSVGPKVYVNDQQEQLCVKMLTCAFTGQLAVGSNDRGMSLVTTGIVSKDERL